jgi:23S rRNA A2030 N6-methylase RlmJ
LVIVNPPFVLEQEAATLLPELTRALAQDDKAAFWLERLGTAKVSSQ